MNILKYLILSVVLCLISCKTKINTFNSTLEKVLLEESNDSIQFGDTTLLKARTNYIRIEVYKKDTYVGYIFKASEIDSIWPRKFINYPSKNSSLDAKQDFGNIIFQSQCAMCHNSKQGMSIKFDSIGKVSRPPKLNLKLGLYYFINDKNYHWYFDQYSDLERESLKYYFDDPNW